MEHDLTNGEGMLAWVKALGEVERPAHEREYPPEPTQEQRELHERRAALGGEIV